MRIGVDLGGSKIEALALDDDGAELARRRVATPADSHTAIVAALAALVRELERELGAEASVGVATPGAISPSSGLMKNSNTVCLNGQPLDRLLSDALSREVRMANDANCFALSEAVDGAAADADVVFGVIIGTGTGGGVVVGRRVLLGPNAVCGEWGHNPLPWQGQGDAPAPDCYCGKQGCIESYVSGPALARDHRTASGQQLTAAQIAQAATAGEPAAVASLARHARRLAKGLASVINVLDPDVIVLGGGLSNVDSLYGALPPLLADYVFSDDVRSQVRKALHGDSSGVRGAAWLW